MAEECLNLDIGIDFASPVEPDGDGGLPGG